MTTFFAETALLSDGWADNVLIEVDQDGLILGLDQGKRGVPEGAELLKGPVIPGMPNVHSHAFQRAMAGLAERASSKKDSFWSWRETMYRFLEHLGPDEVEAIAAQLYVEMLKSGYTTVGEFHYLHHQPGGVLYDDIAQMSHAVIEAAVETGISITHMPVLYLYGGFGGITPLAGQRRFLNQVPAIVEIVTKLRKHYQGNPFVRIGFAHHSLRAVTPDMLAEATTAMRKMDKTMPIHIHAAEQLGEVDGCIAWSSKRPIEWLLDNAPLDRNWTIIHATHMTEQETSGLAQSGAVTGLCPTTEANLGDGIFPLMDYLRHDGVFAIGSDSHISVSPVEELRWLEYGQRLTHRERTLVKSAEIPSVGAALYDRALSGGARSMGRNCGKIEIGAQADMVVLDGNLPCLEGKLRDHVLDSMIFAGNENPVKDVMVGGRWVVKARHHKRQEKIFERYRKVLKKLLIET